jgi:hypothetical protein
MQPLSDVAAVHDLGKRFHESQRVVLSHADDDNLAHFHARAVPLLPGAFHLLGWYTCRSNPFLL